MNPLLKNFRDEFLDKVLELLWRQWSALGVAGSGAGDADCTIDPEALLAASCGFARYEPRLFDEMLDCLQTNGWVINTQRLGTVVRDERWGGMPVLGAVAGFLSSGSQVLKWKRLSEDLPRNNEPQPLFYFKDGRPLPVVGEAEPQFAARGFLRGPLGLRGYSLPFAPLGRGNLLVQLRALLGVNVRAELVLYLLTHESGHAAEMARATCFHKRTVQQVLGEMNRSGIVEVRETGREKYYWIRTADWKVLLRRREDPPPWRTWPPLWSALDQIWLKLQEPQLEPLDPLMLSSVLRQLMVKVRPAIERAGFAKYLSDDRQHLGESYLPVFVSDVGALLDAVSSSHPGQAVS